MTNDQTVTQALESCPNPWCGSHNTDDSEIWEAQRPIVVGSRGSDEKAVACPVCPITGPWKISEAEAITAWNTRTAHSGEVRDFQSEVGEWMLACFGEEIAADKIERADRFIEEALELAQTIPGFTVERARALVEYVFARPVGERGQEVGGVGVTLAALCNTFGLNIREEWERELTRVWTKVEAIRAKQATKPTGSALPVPVSGEGRSNGAGGLGSAWRRRLPCRSLRDSRNQTARWQRYNNDGEGRQLEIWHIHF